MKITIGALTNGNDWITEEYYTNGLRYEAIAIDSDQVPDTDAKIVRRRRRGSVTKYAIAWRHRDGWACPDCDPYGGGYCTNRTLERAVNDGMGWRTRDEMLKILKHLLNIND